jgi:hypothetical protein
MSQPDTLLDELDRVAFAAPTFGYLLNRSANEIRRLRAEVESLSLALQDHQCRGDYEMGQLNGQAVMAGEVARLRSEVASLQAQATTYWNSLDDLKKALKLGLDELQGSNLDGTWEDTINRIRAALANLTT